jgi:small conductance mechanosensitive channel
MENGARVYHSRSAERVALVSGRTPHIAKKNGLCYGSPPLALLLAAAKVGVDVAPLAAGIGVGIGLATQGVLSNLFAGLTIIFTKPFRVGEYIEVIGVEGQVTTIDLFTTKLPHMDQSIVVIPNRKIVGEVLHNYGSTRQLALSVGVAYGTDIDKLETVARSVLKQNPRVLAQPAPILGISAFGDSEIV